MKALIVISGQSISDEEMKYLSKDCSESIQKIASNSYLFDLKKSAHALAAVQEHVARITNTYHIFYLNDDVDVFKYPAER